PSADPTLHAGRSGSGGSVSAFSTLPCGINVAPQFWQDSGCAAESGIPHSGHLYSYKIVITFIRSLFFRSAQQIICGQQTDNSFSVADLAAVNLIECFLKWKIHNF